MARFSGATVLLILVATVSVYTCAILGGAALGRTLDWLESTTRQPADSLRVSVTVSVGGAADYFAKELCGSDSEGGRPRRRRSSTDVSSEGITTSNHGGRREAGGGKP